MARHALPSFFALSLLIGCSVSEADPARASSAMAHASEADGAPSAAPAPSASESPSAAASASPPPKDYEDENVPEPDLVDKTLAEQRESMLRRMRTMGGVSQEQSDKILAILKRTRYGGQGNPESSKHPFTRQECMDRRKAANLHDEKKPACGAPFMVPIFNPATETEADAKVCIDRYEFPNLPCEYPATWITTRQADDICKAEGKRLCDAHEWEGGCAGALLPPKAEYQWGLPRLQMTDRHNNARQLLWAYGDHQDLPKCGTDSPKSKECFTTVGFKECGSNTYPAGSFPECRSSFGVYDQHGNAAEHMLLPIHERDLHSKGGEGEPEMKGSWFIFQRWVAHPDDCRWRAPAWHVEKEGMNHANYHLGFRCCKDIP